MTLQDLREAVHDFYQYHDPFKPEEDIQSVIKFAEKKGIRALNRKLRGKYGEDLFNGAEGAQGPKGQTTQTRVRALSTVQTPAIGEYTTMDDAQTRKLEERLKVLEASDSTKAIKQNLISFYMIATPERFSLPNPEDEPFIIEILNWTYRFGMQALINNLRNKYFNDSEPGNSRPNTVFSGQTQASKKPELLTKDEIATLREKLTGFYNHYNPARLQEGIDDLILFARRKGVDKLNAKLRERYADDVDSFTPEKKAQNEYKQQLFERLFEFYTTYDQQQINQGLSRIVSWAAKKGEKELNQELQKLYGVDLNEFEAFAKKAALGEDDGGFEATNEGHTEDSQEKPPPGILQEIAKLS